MSRWVSAVAGGGRAAVPGQAQRAQIGNGETAAGGGIAAQCHGIASELGGHLHTSSDMPHEGVEPQQRADHCHRAGALRIATLQVRGFMPQHQA